MQMNLTLSQRTYLLTVLPVIVVIIGSFIALNWVEHRRMVRDMSQELVRSQMLLKEERMAGEQRLKQSLAILTESAGLKAGMTLLRELSQAGALSDKDVRAQIQSTLDTQLRDLKQLLHFDLYVLADSTGRPRASVPPLASFSPSSAVANIDSNYFSVVSVPINSGLENLGSISVGSLIDLKKSPMALVKGNRVLASSVPGFVANAKEPDQVVIAEESYVASYDHRGEFTLISLRAVEPVLAPSLKAQQAVMISTVTMVLIVCVLVSFIGTRSMTRPLEQLSSALKEAGKAGRLPSKLPDDGSIQEVSQLVKSFEGAATAVQISNDKLEQAYMGFMGAMAEALDARDPYTAGHSRRVADYSVRIARALKLDEDEIERIRIGAMLHDIGKIGVPDYVLHKHEKLTDEEFAIIKQHPQIGRRILERVGRFERFLPAVELHHENHDGTGYPHGLAGDGIPIDARVIHVADAYDAMSSDRPYRKRMPEEKVRRILQECSGTQFDPRVIDTFFGIRTEVLTAISNDLESLSNAITVFQNPDFDGLSADPGVTGSGDAVGAAPASADLGQRAV